MLNFRRNDKGEFLVTEAEFLADPAEVLQQAQQGLKIVVECPNGNVHLGSGGRPTRSYSCPACLVNFVIR